MSPSFRVVLGNMDAVKKLYYDPKVVADLSGEWDAVLVVAKDPKDLPDSLNFLTSAITAQIQVRGQRKVTLSVRCASTLSISLVWLTGYLLKPPLAVTLG